MRCLVFFVPTLLLVGCSLSHFEKIPAKVSPRSEQQSFLRAVEQLSDEQVSAELEGYVQQSSDVALRRTAQLVLQLAEKQKNCAAQLAVQENEADELENLKLENLQLTETIEKLKSLLIELEKRPQ